MDEPAVVRPMSARQRDVFRLIVRCYVATGETPSQRQISRRLGIHLKTVQEHLQALCDKGWLTSPNPDGLRCDHDVAA